jgi:hypothetical protein
LSNISHHHFRFRRLTLRSATGTAQRARPCQLLPNSDRLKNLALKRESALTFPVSNENFFAHSTGFNLSYANAPWLKKTIIY